MDPLGYRGFGHDDLKADDKDRKRAPNPWPARPAKDWKTGTEIAQMRDGEYDAKSCQVRLAKGDIHGREARGKEVPLRDIP